MTRLSAIPNVNANKFNSLTPQQRHVIINKGTDRPTYQSSDYQSLGNRGSYLCRGCGVALFLGEHQFASHCGWPSFDNQLTNSIQEIVDADGHRTEILCQRCGAHLGHVFDGEGFTPRNRRHCVNMSAIEWVASETVALTEEIIVAGGCFWGIAHLLKQATGVLLTEAGYIGGHVDNPRYDQICRGNSGHFEAVRVVFDRKQTSLTNVLTDFFECHDPFQQNGQGVDIGPQYRSAIFVYDDQQALVVEERCQRLQQLAGQYPATQCLPVSVFWPAEEEHQAFFEKHPHAPHCHRRVKRF